MSLRLIILFSFLYFSIHTYVPSRVKILFFCVNFSHEWHHTVCIASNLFILQLHSTLRFPHLSRYVCRSFWGLNVLKEESKEEEKFIHTGTVTCTYMFLPVSD